MEKKIIKKTRNRVAVVCANCKLKKVKCDREKPCYNCVRNGLADSCTYETRQVSRRRNRRKTASITMPKDNSCGVPENESLSDYKSSITDYEIGSTFKKFILQKPSNTQLKSFDFLIYFGGRNLLSYKFLLAIKEIFNDERRWWKLNRIKSNQMFQSIQWNTYEGDDCNPKLNFKIEKLIRNNYYAILERLTYFQTDLNLILFNSYIPMAVVHSIFHHYISITPVGAIFKRPKKCYEYSFLALIMSLVELTNIFTQPEPARFQFQLVCSPNEFNNISLELLNSSNYLRKCTIFSVYTLLNLRLTLMIYGNSHSAGFNMQNSHSLFFNAVKLCMHMGIHVDQDEVEYLSIEKTLHDYEDVFFCKNIPAESLKKLWNYLLVLDAIYFIESSRTPTIDDRYCHGYYKLVGDSSKNLEHYLLVIKNISLSLSSKSCSLKILLQNISNLSEIVSTYGVFADLQHLERNESRWHEFYLKIKFLKFLLILLFQLHLFLQHDSLSEVYPSKILGDKENKKYIEKLKKEVDMKCKIIYIIGLNLIAKISQGQLSSKFIIYIKEIFPTWIGVHTMSFVDLIINDNIEKKIKPDIKYCVHSLSKDTLFNTTELEHLLYSYRSPKSEKTLDHFKDSLTIERLTSYLAYVYESIIKVSALYSDYNFFVTTKMFLFCFYFLFCYLKVNSQISISVTNTSERLRDEVKTVAEKYLKNNKSPSELLRENANELAESMSPEFLLKSKECNIESMEDNNLVTLPIPLTDLDLPIFQQEEFLSLFRDVDHYVSDIFGDFWK